MKKYVIETRWPKAEIKEIDVDRETEKFVFVGGRRIEKHTNHHAIFDRFSDAKSAYIVLLNARVIEMEKQTHKVKEVIGGVLCLSGPTKSDFFY